MIQRGNNPATSKLVLPGITKHNIPIWSALTKLRRRQDHEGFGFDHTPEEIQTALAQTSCDGVCYAEGPAGLKIVEGVLRGPPRGLSRTRLKGPLATPDAAS